jgi:hypothetical protein
MSHTVHFSSLYNLWSEDGPAQGPKHVVSLRITTTFRKLCFDLLNALLSYAHQSTRYILQPQPQYFSQTLKILKKSTFHYIGLLVFRQLHKMSKSNYQLYHFCPSFHLSVCLSVLTELGYQWTDFYESDTWVFFENLTKKFQTSLTLMLLTWRIWWAPNNASRWQMGFNSVFKGLRSDKNKGNFTRKPSTFMIISRWIIVRVRNISEEFVENIQTHFLYPNIFPENRTVYEIIRKNKSKPDKPQMAI